MVHFCVTIGLLVLLDQILKNFYFFDRKYNIGIMYSYFDYEYMNIIVIVISLALFFIYVCFIKKTVIF